jgi:hypothetical protein
VARAIKLYKIDAEKPNPVGFDDDLLDVVS